MTLARPFKGNNILGASMSDMLQLVVEIRNPQAKVLLVTSAIRVPNIDDKLKHVGHSSREPSCASWIVLPAELRLQQNRGLRS
jgi:hypothetical protein